MAAESRAVGPVYTTIAKRVCPVTRLRVMGSRVSNDPWPSLQGVTGLTSSQSCVSGGSRSARRSLH